MGPPTTGKKLTERDLSGWKFLTRFRELLSAARVAVPRSEREQHGLRRLAAEEYLSLFLLGLFNPVITSMRGLCAASAWPRVQTECGSDGAVALARFSEAQKVFDPALLQEVMRSLVEEGWGAAGASVGGLDPRALQVVDSTLWKVVPRMKWAHYGGGRGGKAQAVRLHLKLRVIDGAPAHAVVTTGKTCERKAWRGSLRAGEIYVGDRNYGMDYHLLSELEAKGCGFLVRLRASAVHTEVVAEELSAQDQAAGVVAAGRAKLGGRDAQGPWRIVRVERPGQEPVVLVASAAFDALTPAEIAALYRQRWQVELFFRWLKCLLPCRHFFAESERGVAFQIYLALICALLLAQTAHRRPSKRLMEALQFHHLGWASATDLQAVITRELTRPPRKKRLEKSA